MNIGIDVDGVLADIMKFVDVVNARYGLHVVAEEYNDWSYFQNEHGISTDDVLSAMDAVWNAGWVTPMEPHILRVLSRLKEAGHQITVITKRTYPSHRAVVGWLHDELIPYDDLVLLGSGSKLAYPIDVLIDDSPYAVEELSKFPGKKLLLRTQPWNESVRDYPSNVERVPSLYAAVDSIIKKGKR